MYSKDTPMPRFAGCTAAVLMTLAAAAAAAQDNEVRVEYGMLRCTMTDRTNFVVVSKAEFACIFEHGDDRPSERFAGTIDQVGLDLSRMESQQLIWAVLAPSYDAEVSAMEGFYGGAGAGFSVGQGAGVSVLVGGFDKSFALQPISVSGNSGAGVSAGVQGLRLRYQGQM
jgi:hypothetical protein